MTKILDLFKLHSKGDTPNSWIWVKFNPYQLSKEYLKLLKNQKQNLIAKKISKKLNAGRSTIEKHLIELKKSKNKLELPLPIIIELTKITNPNLKYNLINSFEYFICKSDNTNQKTKAIKNLNKTFSKLIGAFIADGHSKPEGFSYRLRISDGKKDLIEICSKWIKDIFNISSIIRLNKEKSVYNCWFNNKTIGRYLSNIFNITPRKKSYRAKEPKIIKNSIFPIRKAFAKGVIMFDGGVKSSGIIGLSSMSKRLIYDIDTILSLDGIKTRRKYNPKKQSWRIDSKTGRNKKHLIKWLDYFEEGTWKYNRLNFFLNSNAYNIEELKNLFPKHHLSKISLIEVYNTIKSIKSGKIKDITKNLRIADTTIYKYLYILNKTGLVYKTTEKCSNGKNGWSETIYNIK